MARKLSHITSMLSAFLKSSYPKSKICKDIISCENGKLNIPNTVLITQVIGKAEFDKSFYEYLISKNFIHPESQSRLYRLLIKNKSHIINIIEKTNALKYFNIKHDSQQDYEQCCFACYCIIIGISKNKQDQLCHSLTYGYYQHFVPTLFPKISTSQNLDELKQQITRQLNQKWNKKTTIKESYLVETESVEFKLIAKVENYQDTILINQQGKRLNPTRLSSYQKLLQQLTNSYYHFPHPKKI